MFLKVSVVEILCPKSHHPRVSELELELNTAQAEVGWPL